MQKTWMLLLLLCLLLTGAAGCTATAPAEPEAEQEDAVEESVADEGITITGTVVQAAGKQVDLAEKNEYVHSIVRCRWLEQNKVAMEGRLTGSNSQAVYFAVYDVVRELYVYEQYGQQFIWQNDDLDTLVYVQDYSGEGEPSRVLNKKEIVLYETGAQEQISNVAYVPKGIKVEVSDLHGEVLRQVVVEAAR